MKTFNGVNKANDSSGLKASSLHIYLAVTERSLDYVLIYLDLNGRRVDKKRLQDARVRFINKSNFWFKKFLLN